VVTVDSVTSGKRERDLRNIFSYPTGMVPQNFQDLFEKLKEERSKFASVSEFVVTLYDNSLTWSDIKWLKSITKLPILVKGASCLPSLDELSFHRLAVSKR
jgi:(S)-2-hydroxy-acid oxidase